MTESAPSLCPPWCVTAHNPARGEDDWAHVGEPLMLTDGISARLCMSIDPRTRGQDGPYVLVGEKQLSPLEAGLLGLQLSVLAASARGTHDA